MTRAEEEADLVPHLRFELWARDHLSSRHSPIGFRRDIALSALLDKAGVPPLEELQHGE